MFLAARRDPAGAWSWVIEAESVIRIPRESKSKVIRLVPEAVMAELREYQQQCATDEFILPCPITRQGGPGAKARAQTIVKRVNEWMRSIGWDRARYNHTLHELRAYYLRELRKVYGLEVAGEVGEHSDPAGHADALHRGARCARDAAGVAVTSKPSQVKTFRVMRITERQQRSAQGRRVSSCARWRYVIRCCSDASLAPIRRDRVAFIATRSAR